MKGLIRRRIPRVLRPFPTHWIARRTRCGVLQSRKEDEVQEALQRIAIRSPRKLEARGHAAWEYTRDHTRNPFGARDLHSVVGIVDEGRLPRELATEL